MIKATAIQPPFIEICGDHIEWQGIHCLLVNETPGGIQKTLVDPRTVQEVKDEEIQNG